MLARVVLRDQLENAAMDLFKILVDLADVPRGKDVGLSLQACDFFLELLFELLHRLREGNLDHREGRVVAQVVPVQNVLGS